MPASVTMRTTGLLPMTAHFRSVIFMRARLWLWTSGNAALDGAALDRCTATLLAFCEEPQAFDYEPAIQRTRSSVAAGGFVPGRIDGPRNRDETHDPHGYYPLSDAARPEYEACKTARKK